jgi:RHS repeat-associated protein
MSYASGPATYLSAADTTLTSGQPGLGLGGGIGRFPSVQFGSVDVTPPTAVNPASVGIGRFAYHLDVQWAASTDTGSGVLGYHLYRNSTYVGFTNELTYTFGALTPATNYTIGIEAEDCAGNRSTRTNVATSTSNAPPTPPGTYPGLSSPRQVGVRPAGSYWGAGGESIDMLSGNLHYGSSLVQAGGRGGQSALLKLGYNSQLWRQDGGGIWKLGADVGYGMGWRLMAGSVFPYWSDSNTLAYWIFTDASGAEYKLDKNTADVWTTTAPVYVAYDDVRKRLYFNDGSFWVMGSVAAGTEADAGTRYATVIQDRNGNQIILRYKPGLNQTQINTSARINEVEDARSPLATPMWSTRFTYNTDSIPHLTTITTNIGSGQAYTFTYTSGQTLYSPFGGSSFGAVTTLASVRQTSTNLTSTFSYGLASGGTTAELVKVILPYGGELRWNYASVTMAQNRTHREVAGRELLYSAGAPSQLYAFTRPAGDGSLELHSGMTLTDASGTGKRAWTFSTTANYSRGLETRMEEQTAAGVAVRRQNTTWAASSSGRPYVQAINTVLDPGTGDQKETRTWQAIDADGNVTQVKQYEYNSLSTPVRTTSCSYVTTATYRDRYIRNLVSACSQGGYSLLAVTYDGYPGQLAPAVNARQHDTANYGVTMTVRGNVTSTTSLGKTQTVELHNVLGEALSAENAAGVTTDTSYSGTNNFTAPVQMTVAGNANLSTTLGWSSFLGLTSESQPNGYQTSIGYDTAARPQTTTNADGETTSYAYMIGAPQVTATYTVGTVNRGWTKTYLDGLGRAVKVERGSASTGVVSVVETEYAACPCSPLGKVKRVSRPRTPGGTVYWTTYNYDATGRTISVVQPASSGTTTYSYAGNTVTGTDPAGAWKKYTRNALGNLVEVREPNPEGGSDYVTTYQYNNLDQLTRVEMPRPYNNGTYTQVRTWTYNTNGQLTAQTEPETGTTTYQYLSSGLLWKKTDAKGQVTEHVYDSSTKRLAMLKRGGEQCEWVGFAYDQAQNSYGRLSEITWGTPTVCSTGRMKERFTYNGAGRVTAKSFDVTQFVITGYDPYGNPQGYDSTATVSSGYSYEGGQIKQVGYPAGWQEAALSYEYVKDALGRPIRLNQVQPPQPPVTVFGDVEYGPGGEMTRFGTETRAYNVVGQLTRITKPGAMDLEYRYSATANDGRITSQKDWVSGEEVVFQYDSLKRLIRAESVGPEWGQSFTYDGWGNLRAMNVVKGSAPVMATTADPATNRLGAWGYDLNGNATSLPGATTLNLTYDAANRVMHAADGGSVDEWYAYAADNKRVWKRVGTTGVPVVTFWGIDGTRMGEFTVETRTPQGGSLTLALVRASTPPLTFAGKRIMTEDRLGSVNGSYYPYGQPKFGQTGAGERFATYYKDATGLEYAQNRYYSTTWGRFVTPDPYKASGGPQEPENWNRYGYVGGDPVNHNDDSGLASCNVSGKWTDGSEMYNPKTHVLIWCTSRSGGTNRNHTITFNGSPSDQDINSAMNSLGRELDAEEDADFLQLIEASRRRVKANMTDECAKAIGAQNAKDAGDRLADMVLSLAGRRLINVETDQEGRIVRVGRGLGDALAYYNP